MIKTFNQSKVKENILEVHFDKGVVQRRCDVVRLEQTTKNWNKISNINYIIYLHNAGNKKRSGEWDISNKYRTLRIHTWYRGVVRTAALATISEPKVSYSNKEIPGGPETDSLKKHYMHTTQIICKGI